MESSLNMPGAVTTMDALAAPAPRVRTRSRTLVATFTATFPKAGEQLMPCHEYCGTGHEAMWARVQVLPRAEFDARARGGERLSCVPR